MSCARTAGSSSYRDSRKRCVCSSFFVHLKYAGVFRTCEEEQCQLRRKCAWQAVLQARREMSLFRGAVRVQVAFLAGAASLLDRPAQAAWRKSEPNQREKMVGESVVSCPQTALALCHCQALLHNRLNFIEALAQDRQAQQDMTSIGPIFSFLMW